jgi:hypothetical protein
MSDLPPKPENLSSSATEAEKLERDAVMKERKRCQDKANSRKRTRAKGAERSQEEIGAVSTSNSKRAKGADRSQEEIGAVSSSNGKRAKRGKRAKGADRSQEEIGAVSSSNGKRAKRGGHGGHRDGTGRKLEQEAVVASTIRRGREEYDVWRVKLCPNDETYVIQPKLNFHPIKSTSLSDIAAKVFMKYPTAEVP